MKKIFLIKFLILVSFYLFAQTPQAFNYQAVLRDVNGDIRASANVTIRIDVLQGSASGTSVYAESFAVTTNSFGLINIQVGKGSVISGTFATINWGGGPYFIKVS